jgi:hypothetical protein
MRKLWMLGSLLLALAACQVAPEKSLSPLPEKVTGMPYGRLLERARVQATQASEAYFVDNWTGLVEAANGLEQTAQFLAKADDVPVKHRDTLATASNDLGRLAASLKVAAEAKDVKKTNTIMTSIQAKVREMRLGDGM